MPKFIICTEAGAVTYGTMKIQPREAVKFTRQLRQPKDHTSVSICILLLKSPIVAHVNYSENVVERQAILELLVLSLLGLLIKLDSPLVDIFKNVSFS